MSTIPGGVLAANHRAIIKGDIGGQIRQETKTVDEREVDGGARGGFASGVEDGLGVEGGGPAYCVDPAEEAGEDGEKADDHCCYVVRAMCERDDEGKLMLTSSKE